MEDIFFMSRFEWIQESFGKVEWEEFYLSVFQWYSEIIFEV